MLRATAFAALLACAGAAQAQGLFDDNEARRRIDVLRQQLEATQKAVDDKLANAADRNAILDLSRQIDALRAEITNMRGQVEVLTNQAETANKRQTELYQDIDTRLLKLEKAQQAAAPEKSAAAEPEASAAEQKAYQAALDQFKLGNYALAVAAMQGFLVTYPSSPLASNAQYWIGMAYSGQRDYKNAITAQRKVLMSWPDSNKAPDALLSIASAQETMGDRRSAQKTLEELVAKYPASSAAASAKQRLAATPRR
ncbi:MAG TPA: tol-pal system protein YbgF [Burkholderiales bacterium]|jgi:tol-pal system protein YbgF|nr:tol-pal system protein YbgF [Burkholderiales bacterium]